ncbi:MAG: GNAT family N-acetyltransferase [Alphaproteobacteria bacterium]
MEDESIFRTARFLIREYDEADRDGFLAYQTDPEFARHHTAAEAGREAADALFDRFLAWRREQPRRNHQFAIADVSASTPTIGSCGVRQEGCAAGEAIIGIELAPAYWRRQAGTEVLSALIPWAFERLQLDALLADTAPGNRAAARLAETMGFVRTRRTDRQWWRLARPTAIDKNQIDEPAFQRSDRLDR